MFLSSSYFICSTSSLHFLIPFSTFRYSPFLFLFFLMSFFISFRLSTSLSLTYLSLILFLFLTLSLSLFLYLSFSLLGTQPGSKVYRHLINGDVLLVNRQPTLHKPGIMAHKVCTLPLKRTIITYHDYRTAECIILYFQATLSVSEDLLECHLKV